MLIKDDVAKAGGEQLKYCDVQPLDHLRWQRKVPVKSVHETTHAWRRAVGRCIGRAKIGESLSYELRQVSARNQAGEGISSLRREKLEPVAKLH